MLPPPRSSLNPQPIEKSFSTLMSFAQDPELNFDKVLFMAEDHPARLWLNNLLETSDFTTGSEELKKKLSQVVLGFFKYVVEHDEFSEFFRLFLDTANVSCVDRVTMSVIDLEILINLKKAQETSTPPLEQLRAVWATHLLHEIADAKVAKMPLVDALDTHLAYLIQCKEALALAGIELPFSSGKMKFFTYIITGVELSDLEEATTKVLNTMSGPNWSEKFVNFLFAKNNYIAEESLRMFKASYADGIKEIETQKEVLSDQAEELAAKASSDETDPKDKPTDQEVQEAYKAVQEYEKKAYVDLVRSTAES